MLTYFKYTDLEFWKNREKQLVHFYMQIDQNIGKYLTITKSPCMDIFRQIIETTVTGKSILKIIMVSDIYLLGTIIIIHIFYCFYLEKRDANVINMFLETLTEHINVIEGVGLVESKVEIYVIWRKLACIWINCPNFQNYNYIIILIKIICNMVMIEVRKTNLHFIHEFLPNIDISVFKIFRADCPISR